MLNAKVTEFMIAALVAIFMAGEGGTVIEDDVVMKPGPSANTRVNACDLQVRDFKPITGVYDPQLRARPPGLSSDISPALRRYEKMTGLERSIKRGLDFFRGLRHDYGAHGFLWWMKVLQLKKLASE